MILENPLQIGFPATINTDACLGFAAYAFQSAEVLFGPVQSTHDILIRLEGRRCKGHSDRQHTTQRAKVGYCPCCTRPTHVALSFFHMILGKMILINVLRWISGRNGALWGNDVMLPSFTH